MTNIYVLKLESGKYYIGKTHDLLKRLKEHFTSYNSAAWTKRYKPIYIDAVFHNADEFDEDKITLKYIDQYGIENVRGGSFCDVNLNVNHRSMIQRMLASKNDKCFICNQKGHFAKSCRERKSIL